MEEKITYGTLVEESKKQFLLVSTNEKFEMEKEFARQAFESNKRLRDTLQTVQGQCSLKSAVVNIANTGITLNPARQQAYLVPRTVGGTLVVCLDISYKGLMDLAYLDGTILTIIANVVAEGEEFIRPALSQEPIHNIKDPFKREKRIRGAFCATRLKSGDWQTKILGMEDLEKIKSIAPGSNSQYSPWKGFANDMYIKTAIKAAAKMWPAKPGSRLYAAIKCANEADGFKDVFNNGRTIENKSDTEIEQDRTALLEEKSNTFGASEEIKQYNANYEQVQQY